jgi:3-hydroxyisobutyrate dehydrogenase
MSVSERIGFVGLGRMGANMARRLKDCGYSITAVHDARPETAGALAQELGAQAPGTLAGVTAAADIILTVVTDDRAMDRIFSLKGDSLLTGARGRTFINCATLSPAMHVEVARRARKAGADCLEACMASSITQARNGTLYLMVGGEEAVYQRVKPLLTPLSDDGKLLRYIGKSGQAAQLKALVNMVMNINTAGLAEGLALAAALKLDLGLVREVFSQTGAASRVLVTDGEDMQNRDHSCFFSAGHAAKDSGIAATLAREAGIDAPLARAALAQYTRMVKAGLGELDKSGIAELTFKGRGPRPTPTRRAKAKAPTKAPAPAKAKPAAKSKSKSRP